MVVSAAAGGTTGSPTYLVTGLLQPDLLPYTVEARSSSVGGWGPWSTATVQPPPAVEELQLVVAGQEQLQVQVGYPRQDNGGRVTKVELSWRAIDTLGPHQQTLNLTG